MAERRCDRWAGFTLIEVVMVMALVGLIAAIALPRIDFSSRRSDGAAVALSATLMRAQRTSVTNGANVNVQFDVSGAAVLVHEDDDNDNVVDGSERVRRVALGEGIEFGRGNAPARPNGNGPVTFTRSSGGNPVVIFRRDGSASENGTLYVTSLNASTTGRVTDARAVEVVRATGRAERFRYTGSTWVRQ